MINFAALPLFQAQPLHGTAELRNPPDRPVWWRFTNAATQKFCFGRERSWCVARRKAAAALGADPCDLATQRANQLGMPVTPKEPDGAVTVGFTIHAPPSPAKAPRRAR